MTTSPAPPKISPLALLHLLPDVRSSKPAPPYAVPQKATECEALVATTPGLDLHQLATLVLAAGHIPLAEELVQRGAVPKAVDLRFVPAPEHWCFSWMSKPKPGSTLGVAWLLSLDPARPHVSTPFVKNRLDVLEYAASHPQWPLGINDIVGHHTPIMQVLGFQHGVTPTSTPVADMLRAMIKHGSDPTITTPGGTLPAMLAVMSWPEHPQDPPAPRSHHNTPEAALKEQRDEFEIGLRQLAEWGVDLSKDSHVTLAHAWYHDLLRWPSNFMRPKGSFGVYVQTMIEHGMVLTHPPKNAPRQSQPFVDVLEKGIPDLVQLLVDHKMPADWVDPETNDTLLTILTKGGTASVKALHLIPQDDLRSVVNVVNHSGQTALHVAVASMNVDFVKLVLALGGDPNALNAKGKLPLEAAKRTGPKAQKNLDQIAQLLEKAGGQASQSPEHQLLHACKAAALPMIKRLLQSGTDVNVVDKSGHTPLMCALKAAKYLSHGDYNPAVNKPKIKNLIQVVHTLIAGGASHLPANKDGDTALHIATDLCIPGVVEALLKAGASIDVLNKKNQRPVDLFDLDVTNNDFPISLAPRAAQMCVLYIEQGLDLDQVGANGVKPFRYLRRDQMVKSAIEKRMLQQSLGGQDDVAPKAKTKKM